MAEPTPNPAPPAETPEVAGEDAGPSKKALKKAEAKAKKGMDYHTPINSPYIQRYINLTLLYRGRESQAGR